MPDTLHSTLLPAVHVQKSTSPCNNEFEHYPVFGQDEGSFPLLVEDWGAIEEVLLLDAVEQDGFGNWCDCVAIASNPGLPRPDFISQPWRKIGEYLGSRLV